MEDSVLLLVKQASVLTTFLLCEAGREETVRGSEKLQGIITNHHSILPLAALYL